MRVKEIKIPQTKEADYKSFVYEYQNGSGDIARKPRTLSLKKIASYGHLLKMDTIRGPFGTLGNKIYETD